MGTSTTKKFDNSCIMREHVIEITNIIARLKILKMKVDVNFVVQFIINLLLSKYEPFK